jgi:hypothetical protein
MSTEQPMNRHTRRAAAAKRPKICLNLIVRDEAEVIERCLRSCLPIIDSCLPIIDSWCIVDTGSVDRTKEIIRDVLKDVPGELLEEPWQNFGYNKTHALRAAEKHGDFALLMDADDTITVDEDFQWLVDFTADSYNLRVVFGNLEYDRPHLVRLSKGFFYEGVRHEYLTCKDEFAHGGLVPKILYSVVGGGARSKDPEKYLHDAQALEATLKADPNNVRTLYYLGQSYRDAGQREAALVWFEKRAAVPGWAEETFMSAFEAAKCREHLGYDPKDVVDAYFRAWETRPTRAEPLYELARYLRVVQSRFSLAHRIAKMGLSIPRPQDDMLFVDIDAYAWRLLDELAISAFYVGLKNEAAQANRRLLEIAHRAGIPDTDKRRIMANLAFCLDAGSAPSVIAGPEP